MKTAPAIRQVFGVVIVAATYVYFLIFAQFAFLRLAQAQQLAGTGLRFIMGCMAVAGVAGSLWTARRCNDPRARRLLLLGLGGCALAAGLALVARGTGWLAVTAALIGGFLGLLTVSLVGNLRSFFPARRQGLLIGLGTGLAYAVCNVPAVFAGSALLQTVAAIASCLLGGVLVLLPGESVPPQETTSTPDDVAEPRLAFPALVIVFLMLIWLDSGAFYILQNTPALNRFGWGSAALQWNNAGLHFTVALLAGWWLDRSGLTRVLWLAFACLAGAAVCVSAHTSAAQWTHWLYAAGVSLYSVALVFTPLKVRGTGSVAGRAAVLYAVAGWAGSALGIGMAQDLHAIPLWFVWLATAVVVGCGGWDGIRSQRASIRRAAVVAGTGALVFIVAQRSSARLGLQPAPGSSGPQARPGREVYISEGCMNCHSQYVRPGTRDETLWGPAADAAQVLQEQPPLIGNRRQGPDLMNVGNRRSPDWNRLHLIEPRALTPGSRMPSYAHLFAPGDARGEALLAYLAERGADTWEQRGEIRQRWQPDAAAVPLQRTRQVGLFHESCSQCHGDDGAGHGVLAERLGPRKPRDLTRAQWQFIPGRDSPEQRRLEIARVIKFGIPGTSMPGHEYDNDAEVLGLAEYVQSLRRPEQTQ